MIEEKKKAEDKTPTKKTVNGREVKNIEIVCSRHGNITGGAYYTTYNIYKKDPSVEGGVKAIEKNNVFCIACLNEIYRMLQHTPRLDEEGKPIYIKDAEGKEVLDKDGKPIPDTLVGNIDIAIDLADPEKPGVSEEKNIPIDEANINNN